MFITFEGLDFCGKSTQVELLRDYYLKKNAKIKVIREPGGTEISEKIREVLLDKKNLKMTVESEILLFSASRAQLVREIIKPALREGTIIISDRFHDSLTAYQGFGRNIPLDFVEAINKFVIGDCIPDITFFIDLNLEEIEKRKSNSRLFELDRIELSKNHFYEKVREGYLYLAGKEPRFKRINGSDTIENIHKKIISEIEIYEKS
ncbi:MAG TPA: dTMP kinase [Ignavibacteriales bacterium]|nr:dTMP kinase [Ignavibacteriales bacterium]